jgi:hypothetical protein
MTKVFGVMMLLVSQSKLDPPFFFMCTGATMWAGSSAWTSLLLGLVATVVYGAVAVLQI